MHKWSGYRELAAEGISGGDTDANQMSKVNVANVTKHDRQSGQQLSHGTKDVIKCDVV